MNTQFLQDLPESWLSIACVFAALGDKTRQKILLLFEPGERISRKTLTRLFPLSQTAMAHHLNTLARAGLLKPGRSGREVYYTLDLELLMNALAKVQCYASDMYASLNDISKN